MRDSIAPRSYVDSRSQALSGSQAWLCKARSYIARIKPREEHMRYPLIAGRKRLGPHRLSLFSGPCMARAIMQRDRGARIQALTRAGAMATRHSHVVEV